MVTDLIDRLSKLDAPDREGIAGLVKAHKMLQDYLTEIIIEHRSLPGTCFFNRPRKRHHDIMIESRLLKKMGQRIANEIAILRAKEADR